MTLLMGIDLGTSSIKVLITDQRGAILGRGSAGYPMLSPHPGWVEQAAGDWWQAAVLAVRQALSSLTHQAHLQAICVSGQMHGTLLLDKMNQVIYPAIIWPDQRSTLQVREITELVGAERLIEITGSAAATGFQSASLRWVQQNLEEVWEQTNQILLPKDYLRWRLCGEFASDASDAAGTGMFDGKRRQWSPTLLNLFQVEAHLLPPIKPSMSLAGELCIEAAEDFGVSRGIPVFIGASDTAASLLGAGVTMEGELLLTISTGGQLITPSNDFLVDRLGRLHTFCSASEPAQLLANWYLMGATLSAGQSLRWMGDNILKVQTPDAYTEMSTWAAKSSIGAEGLFFMPYLSGKRGTAQDSQLQGSLFGLTLRHGRAELIRAIMEGVVYSIYEKYSTLVENNLHAEQVLLAGGGARSDLWTQIVADVFGLPVRKVLVEEQSAYGAALLAGAGIDHFDISAGTRDWASYGTEIEPDLTAHEQYQGLIPIFKAICKQTRSKPVSN